jgi:signal transduction histidine kinase
METQLSLSEQKLLENVRKAEESLHAAILDKAVAQGKYEIAADILHDIGNAIIGFGSYLTRIKRSLEQNNLQSLQNLAGFLSAQQTAMTTIIGEAKSEALVNMINSITEAQQASQNEINKAVTEQLSLITHIQDILNIQRQYVTGHESHEPKAVNLRSIVTDCISMLSASIDKRSIRVSLDIAVEVPVIMGDRTKLMQVILNLLKNSIEAFPVNISEKTISIGLYLQDGLLVLTIQDNGNGFNETTGDRLFERGFTTKSSGTGLGLNNCKTIIESHNGKIAITSKGIGLGALTTIKLKSV